ncbi:CYTH domain-containing protein [Marinobacteraceae bacterium S3BR75-40.1]
MAAETEIKLTVLPTHRERIVAFCRHLGAGPSEPRHLKNQYFDTPQSTLNEARAALRIREVDGRWIQTLKTKGVIDRGVHRRQEWEWALPEPELDLELLEQTDLKRSVDLANLKPVFQTNFQRDLWLLDSVANQAVEMALDHGEILAGGRRRSLCEFECEHKGGDDSETLLHLVRRLLEWAPAFINPVSKAEQGYYLAGLYRPEPPVNNDANARVTTWLQATGLAWLTSDPRHLQAAVSLLEQLRAEAGSPQVIAHMDAMLARWEPALVDVPENWDDLFLADYQLGLLQLELLENPASTREQ